MSDAKKMAAKGKMLPPCLNHLVILLVFISSQGHQSYLPGSPTFERVVEAFGKDIVDSKGCIDRRILGSKVFASKVGQQFLISRYFTAVSVA